LKDHIRNNDIAVTGKSLLYVLRNHLETATSSLKDANMSYTAQEVLNVIESEQSKYKVILIETEREINNYNNIKYTIDKYRKTIDDIQSNIKVLDIILAELSPKNGLIAKSVSSFLNIIIENVNAIIGTVWDYKMVLRAINVEDEVLNYKFKVDVEDKITIEDISRVSSGMKEIINLSFKTLLYKLLKLENYPVFLDEFGVKLDKVHRSKISELVFKMMNSNYYSQIFLITHIETSYAIFKDVEVLELG
jgi:DNA repair exonuclease SbcCD ATPase subunit